MDDDVVAFTPADVEALRHARALVVLGILGPDRQAALVRTWGRSFARLAEWQTGLLADVAADSDSGSDPGSGSANDQAASGLAGLTDEVLPRVEALQTYVWRRHLAGAAARQLALGEHGGESAPLTVGFVDIVGYTSRSRTLDEAELVAWVERFEATVTGLLTEAGGQVIKNIGDEVLLTADDPTAVADVLLELVRRGADDDDPFPGVRAGLAHGEVVRRLGDVFGPTVNLAARLTSAARPGTVLVDRGVHDALREQRPDDLVLRRVRRLSLKGFDRVEAWALRPAD
ncbi:hypothetical protein GCM10023340_01450 [Nocardioides marinquilinus]|uniref:Guanylate cyclase domain-containing protein n=1 Tax=Nocardioides marinquilinus TaxID=1210400 RepID=A0ABP9P805_9ACTN